MTRPKDSRGGAPAADLTVRVRPPDPGVAGPTAEPIPTGLNILLEVVGGPALGAVFSPATRMTVVGREEGEFRIPDPQISRRHASLEVIDADTIILRDLASTNGTYHNDRLIAFCRVTDGDEIRLGSTVLLTTVDLLG